MCALNSRTLESLPIKTHAGDGASVEILTQSTECLSLLIDDCDRVATLVELLSQKGTDAPASEDDDVHIPNATPPAPSDCAGSCQA